jgi:hypothetical protein
MALLFTHSFASTFEAFGALPSLTEDRSISACLNVAKHGKEKRYTGSAKDQLSSLPF